MSYILRIYQYAVIVLLTITVAIPCSAKREFKQLSGIAINHNGSNNNTKINCTVDGSQQQKAQQQKQQQRQQQNTIYRTDHLKLLVVSKAQYLPDTYTLSKQKIPTHIWCCRFLI